ncbi:Zn-ribbon domain-containing OB-fold protein [soil metagenome]
MSTSQPTAVTVPRLSDRLRPFPELDALRLAAEEGCLAIPHCVACGRSHWYPRAVCPHCHSTAIEFRPAAGDATIHSYTIVRRKGSPYVLAYVNLAEGPAMLTNIVDCDLQSLRIGMQLRLRFVTGPMGEVIPAFAPGETHAAA